MADNELGKAMLPTRLWREPIVWSGLLGGLLAAVLYALQGSAGTDFASVIGIALVISGAAMLAGGLLGFLFGIPRALQREQGAEVSSTAGSSATISGPSEQRSDGARYEVNTNLEQISDWLTKIIVGVGLTQVASIPRAVASYASSTAEALGGYAGSEVFSVALLFYYLIAGFIIGYLTTRLYLPRAFRQADVDALGTKLKDVERKLTGLERQTEIDAKALSIVRRQLNPPPVDDEERVTEADLKEALETASDSVKAQAFYDAANQRRENWRNLQDKPKMERTIPIFRALIECDVDDVFQMNHGQLAYALKDQRKPDWVEACSELTKAIELRGPWQTMGWVAYEFNRAECRIRLDSAFAEGHPSEEETKEDIAADLLAAYVGGWGNAIPEMPEMVDWLRINNVELDLEKS